MKLREVNSKIGNMTEAIAKGAYGESVQSKLNELESQKTALIQAIAEYRSSNYISYTKEDIEEFVKIGQDLSSKPYEQKKIIINTFVPRVEYFDDEIRVHLTLDKNTNRPHNPSGGGDVTVEHGGGGN